MYKLLKPKEQKPYKKRNTRDIVNKALSSKVGKEMSNPMNYTGAGTMRRIASKPVGALTPAQKAAQSRMFHKNLINERSIKSFKQDISNFQAESAERAKKYQKELAIKAKRELAKKRFDKAYNNKYSPINLLSNYIGRNK